MSETPQGLMPPTVQLASLPRRWRGEAEATDPGNFAPVEAGANHRRFAQAQTLRDCAQELDEILSISPRGCWEHPGVMGYQHPECGFCWHGEDGLDVPTSGAGANREPVCPRCDPQLPDGHVSVSRDRLADALTRLDVRVLTSGPAAGMVNAESMADAIMEALAGDPR